MQSSELVKEVTQVIVEAVNLHSLDPNSISAETSLRDGGLELDSIDILEVVVAIEHHFKVKVGEAEVAREHFRTIGQIANYVQLLKGAG
jgi:acyl carrier protein